MRPAWLMRVLGVLVVLACCGAQLLPLQPVYEWETLAFQFPSPALEQRARDLGHYIDGASVPLDLHADTPRLQQRTLQRRNRRVRYQSGNISSGFRNRIIITIPRQGPGRPFTLGVVNMNAGVRPKIQPYPNFAMNDNQGTDCNALTSVFRIDADDCGRLWVLDTGKIGQEFKCPPQLLAFDLRTDTLILRHIIQPKLTRDRTLLITPIADVQSFTGNCLDTFVYMSDAQNFGLIVYDQRNDRSWRVENPLVYPFPTSATHFLAGQNFDLLGGILAMALYPRRERVPATKLYFHAFASITENVVDTAILKNYTLWENNLVAVPRSFQVLPGSRPTQAVTQMFDQWGRLYFGLYDPIAVMRWNQNTPYRMNNFNVMAQNNNTLQFISGVKINHGRFKQDLWLLSCRYQKFMTGTYNFSEVNFRIFRTDLFQPFAVGSDENVPRPRSFSRSSE